MDTAPYSQSVRSAAAPGGRPCAHSFAGFSSMEATALPEQLAQDIADQERLKMARDLHDSFLQDVTATLMQLRAAEQAMQAYAHAYTLPLQQDPVQEHLARAIRLTEDTVQRMRQRVGELRRTQTINPTTAAGDNDLSAALQAHLAQATRRHDVTLDFNAGAALHLSDDVLHEVLHIAGEAVANALKHGAPDCISCSVRSAQNVVSVTISDNGGGFRINSGKSGGFGLIGMKERAALLCGTLDVVSNTSLGVIVRLQFPHGPTTH